VTFAVLAVAIGASFLEGAPKSLPSAALGWGLLFHIERATLVLGGLGAIALVVWRALHGEFPLKFGQLEYAAAKDAAAKSESVGDSQERRIQLIEGLLKIAPPPPES
jgi:hypothetical protein